jgi:hypothetical protein
MSLIRTPDLSSWRRLSLVALAIALTVGVMLFLRDASRVDLSLGDTDDAMRLVAVRELVNGRGWWDQHFMRLQPPVGLYSHWSRLVDGGLAAVYSLFALFQSPGQAERSLRLVWPLLWLLPGAWGMLALSKALARVPGRTDARRESGVVAAAVVALGVLMISNMPIYGQFRPGRVDHHDVQIVLCILALAGAALGRVRGGILCGLATAIGLCVGLEALLFEAAIGAAVGLRYLIDGRSRSGLLAYGLSLALGSIVFFGIQTPPWRWSVMACDALGANLLVGLALTGFGLAATARFLPSGDWRWRFLGLALTGVAAAGVYLGMHPDCLRGPFADVDPAIKPVWLNHVQEVRHWPAYLKRNPDLALAQAVPGLMGLMAWLWLGMKREPGRGLDAGWVAMGLCLLLAMAATWTAIRMGSYLVWFALPPIAAFVADLSTRRVWGKWRGALLATLGLSLLFTPIAWTAVAVAIQGKGKPVKQVYAKYIGNRINPPKPAKTAAKPKAPRVPGCFETRPLVEMANMPAGLVLSETDMGPFILANTRMSALRAPYHRMSWGIMAGYRVLAAPAETAAAEARKLKIDYVLECPSHKNHVDHTMLKADSLGKALDNGKPPSWLEVAFKNPTFVLYRVKPAGPAA